MTAGMTLFRGSLFVFNNFKGSFIYIYNFQRCVRVWTFCVSTVLETVVQVIRLDSVNKTDDNVVRQIMTGF